MSLAPVAGVPEMSSSASSSYMSAESTTPKQGLTAGASSNEPDPTHGGAPGAMHSRSVDAGITDGAARVFNNRTDGAKTDEKPTHRAVFTERHIDVMDSQNYGSIPATGGPSKVKLFTKSDLSRFTSDSSRPKAEEAGSSASQSLNLHEWAANLSLTYYRCSICNRVAVDPIQVLPEIVLACKQCARMKGVPASNILQLPVSLQGAIREILEQGGYHAPPVRRANNSGAKENEEPIGKRRTVHVKRIPTSGPSGSVASPLSMELDIFAKISELQRHLEQIAEAEGNERLQVATAETRERTVMETAFCRQCRLSQRATNGGPNSRQLKLEADNKYEHAEYTAALELYTKALSLQETDKIMRRSVLYGNRSAANFMTQRYEDCISDCLEVLRHDPGNTKMVTRAARSAATMGDLARAVDLMSTIRSESMTESLQEEVAKYKSGLELHCKAEKDFGTVESDERYRMLMAQFSDTVPFRVRYVESLLQQRQYARAVEALGSVSWASRTPKVCYVMAKCLYMSGFEYFSRARQCLEEVAQFDDACSTLLDLINVVDDGKQKGNSNFTQKKFLLAVENYTKAIQTARENHQILRILYCNRAAANKELGRYKEGIEDCTMALEFDAEFSKAYARRARCHLLLGDYPAAVRDFKKAIEFDSNDREIVKELRAAEYELTKESERDKDLYFQLGLSKNATEREIKVKYRELSLRWHPDKCIGLPEEERERAERKFRLIGEAHATLIDPIKRREYDFKVDRERLGARSGFGGFSHTAGGSSEYFRGHTNRYRTGPGGYW